MNIAGIMASQAAMRQATLNANMSTNSEEHTLEVGTKIKFLTGIDKNKVFKITETLMPCARTEGCYEAISESTLKTVYIYPSELKKYGYTVVN